MMDTFDWKLRIFIAILTGMLMGVVWFSQLHTQQIAKLQRESKELQELSAIQTAILEEQGALLLEMLRNSYESDIVFPSYY